MPGKKINKKQPQLHSCSFNICLLIKTDNFEVKLHYTVAADHNNFNRHRI